MADDLTRDYMMEQPVDEAYASGINRMGTQGPQAAPMDWLAALANVFGPAVPLRGGVSEPWRMSPAFADNLRAVLTGRWASSHPQVRQFPRPQHRAFGDKPIYHKPGAKFSRPFMPPELEHGFPTPPSAQAVPSAPNFGAGKFFDEIGSMKPRKENNALEDMIWRYLYTTSRQ